MRSMRLVIALFTTLVTASTIAADSVSVWGFRGITRVIMGAVPGALDSLDRLDHAIWYGDTGWNAGSYRVSGQDGWDADTGFYAFDRRALLLPGQTKGWDLYVWAGPSASPSEFSCVWWEESSPGVIPRLELVQKPTGVSGGPALGTVWTNLPTSFALPFYSTSNGLTGYGFKFTLTMIPEPSSLLALACGLAGIAGAGMRRRR